MNPKEKTTQETKNRSTRPNTYKKKSTNKKPSIKPVSKNIKKKDDTPVKKKKIEYIYEIEKITPFKIQQIAGRSKISDNALLFLAEISKKGNIETIILAMPIFESNSIATFYNNPFLVPETAQNELFIVQTILRNAHRHNNLYLTAFDCDFYKDDKFSFKATIVNKNIDKENKETTFIIDSNKLISILYIKNYYNNCHIEDFDAFDNSNYSYDFEKYRHEIFRACIFGYKVYEKPTKLFTCKAVKSVKKISIDDSISNSKSMFKKIISTLFGDHSTDYVYLSLELCSTNNEIIYITFPYQLGEKLNTKKIKKYDFNEIGIGEENSNTKYLANMVLRSTPIVKIGGEQYTLIRGANTNDDHILIILKDNILKDINYMVTLESK